jgi:23S rRNA pseudouridine1911/1915/1917 synthase
MTPEILYEDNHLFVVTKPAGILTQPSGTQQENMEDICKAWIKKAADKPGNVFLGAVHRIDKPVSGIVMFAKTSKALSRMNAAMRSRELQKIYYALVEGVLDNPEGTLEHYLCHDEFRSMVAQKQTPNAKLCRLHYRCVKKNARFSLLEIELETGRYHQIRAQLSASGHPIVGDAKYNSHTAYMTGSIALHHSKLQFPHPTKEEMITVESPMPEAMRHLIS